MSVLDEAVILNVCRPEVLWLRAVRRCPNCKRRRRFVGMARPWAGPIWTCCGCGDEYSEGWRLERPFMRGWRKRNVARARTRWPEAVRIGSPAYEAWLHLTHGRATDG